MNSHSRHAAALKKVALVLVLGAVMIPVRGTSLVFGTEQAEAQTGTPVPHIDYIQLNESSTSSMTITYPTPVIIKVRVTNVASSTGYSGGIYISFPEFDSYDDADRVDLVDLWTTSGDDDLEYLEYRPGYSTIRYECGSGYLGKAQNLLVAGYAPSDWEAGEEIYLEVKVSPPAPGTYQVYVRVGVADAPTGGTYYNEPSSEAYVDQQCQYVQRRTIEVEPWSDAVYLPMVLANYAPVHRFRAVWTQGSACSSVDRCNQRLDCLQAAGVSRLYYSIYYNGAYYHSDLMYHRHFDSLAYLVREAHARGIQVYAAMPSSYMGWPEHSEWNARFNHPYVTHDWLDFAISDARAFLAEVAREVVLNYDVDGVILDLTRWNESWYRKAGVSAEDISLTVKGIHEQINDVRPIPLAAAVDADHEYAQYWRGQRWVEWLDLGYVDHIEAMTYETDSRLLYFAGEWEDTGHFPGRINPLLSAAWFEWNPGHWREEPKTAAEVLHQIELCDDSGAVGTSLWDDRYVCGKVPGLVEALGGGGW